MDLLYAINHLVFAAFISLFILEFGVALLLLIDYDSLKDRLRGYINPIWGITGTFAVFYIINTATSYPALMGVAGNVFIVPLFAIALLVVVRNSFMVYSEYIGDKAREKLYLRFFSVSSVIIAFLIFSVIATSVSNIGITSQHINLSFIINPYNMTLFISMALIALASAVLFFGIKKSESFELLAAALGLALLVVPTAALVGYMQQGIASYWYLIVADIAFLAAVAYLGHAGKKVAGPLVIVWLFLSANLFGLVQYPYMLGGQVNLIDYLVNPATGFYTATITAAIFVLLVVSIPILLKFVYGGKRYY